MVNRIVKNKDSRLGKQIKDSKLRKEFNLRQKDRNTRKIEKGKAENAKYVDRKALNAKKLEQKRLRKKGINEEDAAKPDSEQKEEKKSQPEGSDHEMSDSSSLSSHSSEDEDDQNVFVPEEEEGPYHELEMYLKEQSTSLTSMDINKTGKQLMEDALNEPNVKIITQVCQLIKYLLTDTSLALGEESAELLTNFVLKVPDSALNLIKNAKKLKAEHMELAEYFVAALTLVVQKLRFDILPTVLDNSACLSLVEMSLLESKVFVPTLAELATDMNKDKNIREQCFQAMYKLVDVLGQDFKLIATQHYYESVQRNLSNINKIDSNYVQKSKKNILKLAENMYRADKAQFAESILETFKQKTWKAIKREDDPAKSIYGWPTLVTIDLVISLTDSQQTDQIVALLIELMRVSTHLKYFPTHLRLFNKLMKHGLTANQFYPCEQYLLHVFDQVNFIYFNAKCQVYEVPQFDEIFYIEKMDNLALKERIIKDTCEALTHYYAIFASNISFPEFINPTQTVIERFKKNVTNASMKKHPQQLTDLLRRNEEAVAKERAQIKNKSLKDVSRLLQSYFPVEANLPMIKESAKLKALKK